MNSLRRFSSLGMVVGLALLLGAQLAALDLSAEIGLADSASYRYTHAGGLRLNSNLALGTTIGAVFYLDMNVWSSAQLGVGSSQWLVPREQDLSLSATWMADGLDLGLLATLFATADHSRLDLGAYVEATVPLAGDMVTLKASLRGFSDLGGLYAEARLVPALLLPLDMPLEISVQAAAGFMAWGYDGLAYNGFSTVSFRPKIELFVGKLLSIGVQGGYVFDVSGGSFGSWPFLGGQCNLAISSQP